MANNSQYPGIQPPRPPVAQMGPPQNTYPSVPMQFRAAGPPRPPPQYMPLVSQQFLPVGRPPMQHLPPHGMVPPPAPPAPQPFSLPDGSRVAFSITYNLSTSATSQVHISTEAASQYQTTSLINNNNNNNNNNIIPSLPLLQPADQTPPDAPSVPVTSDVQKAVEKTPSDWIEHTSRNGKIYYHNKKTKLSSWEKPLDLMTPIERADASTDWKECIAPIGRKYYYNKVTKQSKWKIPDELKVAREQVKSESKTKNHELTKDVDNENEPLIPSVNINTPSSLSHEQVTSPVPIAELSVGPTESSKVTLEGQTSPSLYNSEDGLVKDAEIGTPVGNIEESEKSSVTNHVGLEEKTVDLETQVYETKQEAKSAFKALLENANVATDWAWDQAMRVIINDRRYSALRTLSERKQAFNEFIGQKKKHEAEERRNKQKKAREEFKKMLDESKEITSTTKWSKAIAIFEDDDRFKAVERFRDREDLFEDHVQELEKKERSKALEEHKKNRKEYIEFLKSCDFLTASSQWRKVQDRLEVDESCLRLEKLDRLEIFQEYIRDLEKDEEEQRKLRMEEIRKTERKNRDEFRKLMEGHITSGMLTSKSHWRDYCIKVKELPAYVAVSSNSTGATPKDLFEDVLEELEKQYVEDRDQIKEAVKMRKVSMSSTWTLEEFKNAIAEDITSPQISDVNLKLVFDELQERVREREEKEAKRRKRLGDDFYLSLSNFKEITSSSRWEDFKSHFETRQENWFTVEESFFKEIFDKHITELKKARDERKHREDKAKKSLDRRLEKSRREKDRSSKKDKRRKDDSDSDNGERGESLSFSHEDSRRSGRDKEKKHRKRDRSYLDDMSLDEDDKRDSHRHSLERKRIKQMEQVQTSVEYESRHKRYKRDHNRRGEYDDQKETEDGEVW